MVVGLTGEERQLRPDVSAGESLQGRALADRLDVVIDIVRGEEVRRDAVVDAVFINHDEERRVRRVEIPEEGLRVSWLPAPGFVRLRADGQSHFNTVLGFTTGR